MIIYAPRLCRSFGADLNYFCAVSRFNPGGLFSPCATLRSDCPHVAFSKLKSQAAQGRLALCRPISGLQESAIVDGVERYAHASGQVFFCKRAAWQVASTMGFVLNNKSGSFLGLSQEEEDALHEVTCLVLISDAFLRSRAALV